MKQLIYILHLMLLSNTALDIHLHDTYYVYKEHYRGNVYFDHYPGECVVEYLKKHTDDVIIIRYPGHLDYPIPGIIMYKDKNIDLLIDSNTRDGLSYKSFSFNMVAIDAYNKAQTYTKGYYLNNILPTDDYQRIKYEIIAFKKKEPIYQLWSPIRALEVLIYHKNERIVDLNIVNGADCFSYLNILHNILISENCDQNILIRFSYLMNLVDKNDYSFYY